MTHLLSTFGMRICFLLCLARHRITWGGKAATAASAGPRLQGWHSLPCGNVLNIATSQVVLPAAFGLAGLYSCHTITSCSSWEVLPWEVTGQALVDPDDQLRMLHLLFQARQNPSLALRYL